MFENNKTTLTDEAKSTLDRIASDVIGQRNGYMLELQGYTDGTGLRTVQYRSQPAPCRELFSVIWSARTFRCTGFRSWASEKTIRSRITRPAKDGTQNRRVEVRVLKMQQQPPDELVRFGNSPCCERGAGGTRSRLP